MEEGEKGGGKDGEVGWEKREGYGKDVRDIVG